MGGIADLFSAEERAVLAYVDELVLQNGRVQDATFERLRAHLSDERSSSSPTSPPSTRCTRS